MDIKKFDGTIKNFVEECEDSANGEWNMMFDYYLFKACLIIASILLGGMGICKVFIYFGYE